MFGSESPVYSSCLGGAAKRHSEVGPFPFLFRSEVGVVKSGSGQMEPKQEITPRGPHGSVLDPQDLSEEGG